MREFQMVPMLLLLVVTGAANAAEPATFESVMAGQVEFAELLSIAAQAKRDCSCLDEFEEKSCNDAKANASEALKAKVTTSKAVGEDPLLVKLGKYDFKKHVFPASLPGGVLHSEPFTTCAGKLKPSDPCANFEGSTLGEPEPRVVVVVKNPAWQGQIAVESEDDAQQFRSGENDNYIVKGALVLKVDSVSVAVKENAQLAAKKKMFLAAFDDALKRKSSRMGPDELAQYREERKCHGKTPTQEAVVTVTVSVAGVRLDAEASPEYLVSIPPPSEPKSERLAREAQAKSEREAEAARVKAETEAAERARHPDVFIDFDAKLIWARSQGEGINKFSKGATEFCRGLVVDGGGFQVPSPQQLLSFSKASNRGGPGVPPTSDGFYWTDDGCGQGDISYRVVTIKTGAVECRAGFATAKIICVKPLASGSK